MGTMLAGCQGPLTGLAAEARHVKGAPNGGFTLQDVEITR
jgi:hypothetical protein